MASGEGRPERAAAIERLLSLALVAEAFEELPLAVFVTDSTLAFLACNREATRLCGYSREELTTLAADRVVLRSREELVAIAEHAERTPHAGRVGLRRKDGSEIELDTLTLPSRLASLPVIVTICNETGAGPLAAVLSPPV